MHLVCIEINLTRRGHRWLISIFVLFANLHFYTFKFFKNTNLATNIYNWNNQVWLTKLVKTSWAEQSHTQDFL